MVAREFGWAVTCVALVVGSSVVGCSRSEARRSFDQEFQLTLKAGRGELTDQEKSELLRENHPILAQVGEPQMVPMMELFANLSPELHAQLLRDSYVKWKLIELPEETQKAIKDVINFTLQSRTHGLVRDSESPFSSLNLSDVEVGFAVVELERSEQKVVSWYAFGSQLPSPLWVTIVNAPASKAEEYVQAHMQRLPLLRTMKPSTSPRSISQGRVTYIATSGDQLVFCSVSG